MKKLHKMKIKAYDILFSLSTAVPDSESASSPIIETTRITASEDNRLFSVNKFTINKIIISERKITLNKLPVFNKLNWANFDP